MGGAWARFGRSPVQTGISSPAREESVEVEVEMGMGEEIRGAGWIPWEVGGESCSLPGASAPQARVSTLAAASAVKPVRRRENI